MTQKRFKLIALGLAMLAAAAVPGPAKAWWGPYGWRRPVVVVAPAPYYAPPPIVYAPPPVAYAVPRVWVRAHWQWGRFIPGHWGPAL